MLVFSEQNVIKDPPFSLFHYALNPGGILFLGTSQGIGEFDDLFSVVDRKVKVYQRRELVHRRPRARLGRLLVTRPEHHGAGSESTPPSVRDAALVNRPGDIHYLHGRTGMYLEPSPGETGINNILKMSRKGLRPELAMALHKAVGSKEKVFLRGLRVKTNEHFTRVNLTVGPVPSGQPAMHEPTHYLVMFEEWSEPAPPPAGSSTFTAGIGTVFVDFQLRILRFNPAVCEIINLLRSDVGRPVGHLAFNLVGYDSLVADARAVLDTLVSKEIVVQSTGGKWYAMRIQPYRTLDHAIEGAVITFFDITERVLSREALRRLAIVVHDAHDAISVHDLEGRILAWNPGAERTYGWSENEALTMNVRDRVPLELREEALTRAYQLSRAEVFAPYPTKVVTKGGAVLNVLRTATALINEAGNVYAIATTERADK